MLSFENDYSQGAHEKVLERLVATNREATSGYGTDPYTERAKEKIRQACGCPQAQVHFLVGGTQTNQNVIDAMLAGYEGVVAAKTGHVSLHEAGAIEYSGHKVLTLSQQEGKIVACELEKYLAGFFADENHEHMVFPGMVYISYPTEYGTLYSKKELEALSNVCKQYDIPLYLDGARLGYALASYETDVTLFDIANYCDAFYIGGTKVGAMFGEAVVFTGKRMPKHFLTRIKQHGALLAKGRLLGIQFDTLFTEDLYFSISRHAIDCAQELKKIFIEKGYSLFLDSPTNQQFFVFPNKVLAKLEENYVFSHIRAINRNETLIRICTSWATREEDAKQLILDIQKYVGK